MKNGRVSIIIPVYNTEKYVAEAIESALNQTYSDIEVIAIDDGSTDKSLEVIQNYSSKIKIISNEHRRQPHTLNTGISEMTGEWFKWLSADDVLIHNSIEEQIKEVKNIENKKNWMIASNFYTIDADGKFLEEVIMPNYNQRDSFDLNVIFLEHNIVNGITLLIHKSTLEDYGGFDNNFSYLPDWEMWLRFCLLHNVKIFFIPKFLAKKRIHKEQVSKTTHKYSPMLHKQLHNHILGKLKPQERQKYETALSQYRIKINSMRNEIQEFRKKIKNIETELDRDFWIRKPYKNN